MLEGRQEKPRKMVMSIGLWKEVRTIWGRYRDLINLEPLHTCRDCGYINCQL